MQNTQNPINCGSPSAVSASPEDIIGLAQTAARSGEQALHAVLGGVPAPIYVTDTDGWITYFNEACIDFAGRTPAVGKDRWCVTWKLYSRDGAYLPHESCPMAVAVKERRPVRGALAYAERPDGTRMLFEPYPTPLIDGNGDVSGAVNILVDVSEARHAASLRAQAMRCRRLAQSITDRRAFETLQLMASEYENEARTLRPD
jgi:PAS domain S-box-containing protein